MQSGAAHEELQALNAVFKIVNLSLFYGSLL
jgi:hypothetical protein